MAQIIHTYFLDQKRWYIYIIFVCMYYNFVCASHDIFPVNWISVSDLLDYIAPDADMKTREAQKKQARAKLVNS